MIRQPFFDTHAHLDGEAIAPGLDACLDRARAVGVTDIVAVGASEGIASNWRTLEIVRERDGIHAALGIHPHDANLVTDAWLDELRTLARDPKVVAIGETGLDYHYDHSARDRQRDVFRAFLRMAKDLDLPCIVHTREAEADTIQILREEHADEIGGVVHCFTGTRELATAALELGLHLSFSGVLTFKNADALRTIAKEAPRDRVLVETDCPYLAPIPHRGRPNEPAFVVHTATKLAELWETNLEDVKRVTGRNAEALFLGRRPHEIDK